MKMKEIPNDADAIFLPGTIHGSSHEIYIVYLNPNACNGFGCFEIEICDRYTLKEVLNKVSSPEKFFDILPDYFHGEWKYADYGTKEYDELAAAYYSADFIIGRDGNIEDEYMFIREWANNELE